MKYEIGSALRIFFWMALSKILPTSNLAFLFYLGELAGWGSYIIGGSRKKIVERELSLIFPEIKKKDIRRIVLKAFVDFYTSRTELLGFPHLNKKKIDSLIGIHGKEILDRALLQGRGVIALHPHFGSYLLIIPALGYNGYKISQIALRSTAPPDMIKKTNEFESVEFNWIAYQHKVTHLENSLPGEFINVKQRTAVRKVYQKLKANEIIAVSGTGRSGQQFVPVNLCRRQALLSSGPYEMSARSGAVLVPMFVVRVKGRRHCLMIEEPIDMEPNGGKEAVARAAQKFADHLSAYIIKHPHQFALRLWRMRRRAQWDDHPFFTDYAPNNSWKKYLDGESSEKTARPESTNR